MAWTAPTTRQPGDIITAAIWNTDLKDNLVYLKTEADKIPGLAKITWIGTTVSLLASLNVTANVTWANIDITGSSSADTRFAIILLRIHLDSIAGAGEFGVLSVRKNGDTPSQMPRISVDADNGDIAGADRYQTVIVGTDTGQIFQYQYAETGTLQVDLFIDLLGYIEEVQ
ncbi:hypothetical protein CMI37_08440 [Candidatus Pacearchaeota archaeon]|nr:hypothetical protein [Candidatus Pacearchaeota archaeon]|tara:strand:+ start:16005 stop:16517 length:513 start_codon:yes stop_codon:yes gene_type:complete